MKSSKAFLLALADVRAGNLERHYTPSQTNYVVDPTDKTLWDLKPVLGLTLKLIDGKEPLGTTDLLASICCARGVVFERVVFGKRKLRPLGLMAGNSKLSPVDWTELNDKNADDDDNSNYFSSKRFNRNPIIVTEALAQAGGVCQACKMDAPFVSLKGEPFLEVHHIIPLSSGGHDVIENVIALCPNCHRKQHFGQPDNF